MNFGGCGFYLCMARKKDGCLCSRPRMKMKLKGKYFITPSTCWTHKGQIPDRKERNIYAHNTI